MEGKPLDEFQKYAQLFIAGDRLDQTGLFCCNEESRYRYVYAPHVALMSRPRLALVKGSLGNYSAHAALIAAILVFG